ncbi:hypothetical protein EUX98_g6611 [Antrodiella citrinella]|uniref:Dipeptidyl-peptidase V n=1 Tax=Antrodiella citrinella TaxID=2447956 RepID=A0A4S4MNU2_9APHY|nr:hypothetical protein EUX98_g6611 [Antrodiella citrinella]
MWFPHILGLQAILGFATQVPLQESPTPTPQHPQTMSSYKIDFNLKEGADVLSPKDMIELARPGSGVPSPGGDLVLVPVSKYSFEEKKDTNSIWLAPTASNVQPFEIPLAKGGEAFWLDTHTVAHAVSEGEGKDEVTALYALDISFEADKISLLPDSPALIGKFPTSTVTNFRFQARAGILVFSDNVYEDGNITSVKEQDQAWENRDNSAFVYDEMYERHWDTWAGPKKSTLFSVKLTVDPEHKWHLGDTFTNLLHGTGHNCPVEPFGGTDDFDVSETHVLYTAKDPKLPLAWHTKQDIHIVAIDGSSKPRELTSGKQGATHAPALSKQGDKAAWLELDQDGHEADRHKITIYDLKTNVRYTLTQKWDRSPSELSFSSNGDVLYFSAGDHARNKVYAIPIPATPSASTTHPNFSAEYDTPVAFTHSGFASGVQALANGRLLFTRSSLTSPNDVFVLSGLDSVDLHSKDVAAQIKKEVKIQQLTKFTADVLKAKSLSEGEDFWFEGALGKQVHGWINKPPGFKEGDKKKWPVLLLIHGGPEGFWGDEWSTRWNPNVFAQQGYFIVAINPTGSTSFGQEFTDGIKEDWGGKPFVDIRAGWQYVLDNFPQIDTDRAVAAGASYGGYIINWIQGHPDFGFGFKALVCHDGSFDTRFVGFATDELFFANYEFGGRPWDKDAVDIYRRNNPSEFADNWSTPQLLIHGSKDYRLVEAESLAAFHVLQQKNIPSRLVIFPDENHFVLNHGNSLKWHYEVLRWFDKYVETARIQKVLQTSSCWNDIASGAQSETWSSESRKRPAPDDWTRMSVNSEVQESDVDGQQSAVKRYNIDLSSRRPSYGPLTTGFKSSRTRPAVKKVQTTKLDTAPSFEHSVNDPPLMTGAEGPPTEISPEWLLGDLLKTEGIAVEVKYSRPANESLGWGKGDFEGTEGVVLSVLNLHNNMSTASVKLLDPHDGTQKVYPIPVKYLWPIPPSKAGQNAVILLGQFHGQVAKLRQLEDDVSVWLVSAGSCHFEIETEHMVLLHDVDADV